MFVLPPNMIDGQMAPPPALNNPVMSSPDGGYDWGQRSFKPDLQRAPVMAPHNPVPNTAPTLAQMRNMMTQLHVQQMLNRMQKHSAYHAKG